MKTFVMRVLIMGAVIFGVAYVLPDFLQATDFQTALLAGLVLALVNSFIRPLVLILTIPINLLTLGLFTLVINALMLFIVQYFVGGFRVAGFWQAVVAALIIGVVSSFLNKRIAD